MVWFTQKLKLSDQTSLTTWHWLCAASINSQLQHWLAPDRKEASHIQRRMTGCPVNHFLDHHFLYRAGKDYMTATSQVYQGQQTLMQFALNFLECDALFAYHKTICTVSKPCILVPHEIKIHCSEDTFLAFIASTASKNKSILYLESWSTLWLAHTDGNWLRQPHSNCFHPTLYSSTKIVLSLSLLNATDWCNSKSKFHRVHKTTHHHH